MSGGAATKPGAARTSVFAPLVAELDRWAAEGRCAPFWLRDDDATGPSPALDRLLALDVPMTLAVIPQGAGPALAERVSQAAGAEVAVHGWSHANHAAAGRKSCELGDDRPVGVVLAELAAGLLRVQSLFGAKALPVLVPPWNRIAPAVAAGLPALGYSALSVFGPEAAGTPPCRNAHVDLIDWHGTRGAWPAEGLVAGLIARLRQIGPGPGDSPGPVPGHVGLLTHHLVHDAAAWRFLDDLMAQTRDHPGCRWLPLPRLLPA